MRPSHSRHDRSIALFLLGVVAFSPPLLRIFGRGTDLFGWPLLVLYLFGAWAGLILLLALHTERLSRGAGRHHADGGRDDR